MNASERTEAEFNLPEEVEFGNEEVIARLDRLLRMALDCYNLGLNSLAYILFERLTRVKGDGVPPGLLVVSRRMEIILHPDTHPTVAAIHALEFFRPRIVHIRRTDDADEDPDDGPGRAPLRPRARRPDVPDPAVGGDPPPDTVGRP
jgi:hypothetical protein